MTGPAASRWTQIPDLFAGQDSLMEPAASILVVDDEPNLRKMLRSYLRNAGFTVLEAGDGADALALLRSEQVDLALVDVMLPGIDGLELVRRIRADSAIPIILVTAKGEETSRVAGLEVGADDYVVKPFFPTEVVARVRAQLRRARGLLEDEQPPLRLGRLELEPETRRFRIDGQEVELTRREFDLLAALLERPEAVLSRDKLLDRAWGTRFVSPKTVDVHVGSLRRKLRDAARIEAVRGLGYRLTP
jgi:DNA-binding response OmpR family regulator